LRITVTQLKTNVLDIPTSLQPLEDLQIHVDCVFVI